MNVLRQVSIVGILAIGMTFVILARGIDLSVGSILGIAVVLFAGSMDSRGMIVAIALGTGAAALAGLVNGVGVAYGGLPPFIMTLGMLSFARGLAFIYTGGTPVPINNESFYAFGNGYIAGVPIPSLMRKRDRWERGTRRCAGAALASQPFCRRRSSQLSRMSSRAEATRIPTRKLDTTGGRGCSSEFSSLARGAVTPLGLYGLARRMADVIAEFGVQMQESNNAYSRAATT
jgi:ABC-type xylose transport system permease subunit